MARQDAAEAELVHAILDSELDAEALAEKATEVAGTLAEKLKRGTRAIMAARRAGLPADKAEEYFRYLYIALMLRGFVEVAKDVEEHNGKHVDAVIKAAKALKSTSAMKLIDKLEKEQRKAERQNGQP